MPDISKPSVGATGWNTAVDALIDATNAAPRSYLARLGHTTVNPHSSLLQLPGGRICCGVDPTSGKVWSFNGSGIYQVDSPTATNWAAVTLPTNIATSGAGEPKIVVWTPPAGVPTMFLVARNTSTDRLQVWSAPVVARTVAPTWTGPLLELSENATMMPTNIRAATTGVFVGEYTLGTNLIAGGPSLFRSTNGTSFSRVLGPLATTRHLHSVYEDPFAPGTIYANWGDGGIPYWTYKSTDGGATFTGVESLKPGTWQTVGMGFTPDRLVFISDAMYGGGAFVADRATLTPRWATMATRPGSHAVPGGTGGRIVTDLGITSGSVTVTSATASFTAQDVGRYIEGPNSLVSGSYIKVVNSATSVDLNAAATASGSNVPATICADRFYATAYVGWADPSTGYIYMVSNDTAAGGTVGGLWVLTQLGGTWTLLFPIFQTTSGASLDHYEMYEVGGYLYFGRYGPYAKLGAVAAP